MHHLQPASIDRLQPAPSQFSGKHELSFISFHYHDLELTPECRLGSKSALIDHLQVFTEYRLQLALINRHQPASKHCLQPALIDRF